MLAGKGTEQDLCRAFFSARLAGQKDTGTDRLAATLKEDLTTEITRNVAIDKIGIMFDN